ncbi:hypothetical protein WIW50_11575 [Flavobacteriaceae bacterium 3-367]
MRVNHPKGYINWLKTTPIFKKGELENLPKFCIVLHDSLIIEHLTLLGYTLRNYINIKIGATDPIEFYVLRESQTPFEFILMNGLPGSGGISTQVAELSSLGCKYFIHIGTCGLFNEDLDEGKIILSNGSLKDQAATLLSDNNEPISYPDNKFLNDFRMFLEAESIEHQQGLGITIPIFYHQPKKYLLPLIESQKYQFIEMEQSSFFETCKLNKTLGLSLVSGSDRYVLEDGNLNHKYYDLDQNRVKNEILLTCINYFKAKEDDEI